MKIAYFDLFSGISGDMIVGALIDAGVRIEELEAELEKLGLGGFSVSAGKVRRNGIAGTQFMVEDKGGDRERTYRDIETLIVKSGISPVAKDLSLRIFKDLARAEGKVHGTDPDKVHFHEIGAVDSIIDIVGAAVSLEKLGIEKVCASKVHVGRGIIECRHGKLPAPAPATMELLEGIPVYSTGIEDEIVTPTGAAVIRNISGSFGNMPEMVVEKTAYGAGTKILDLPNLLRVVIGEAG